MTYDFISQIMKLTRTLTENRYRVTHEVGPAESGQRLDLFLKRRYPKRSRRKIQRSIDEGSVKLHRTQNEFHPVPPCLKASTLVLDQDSIEVLTERRIEPPVNFDFTVLFEDDFFLVINKPANLPVHPAGRYFFNTLFIYLRTKYKKKTTDEFYLIHRIDRETSGVLVIAKKKFLCEQMLQQFKSKKIKKTYLALTHGKPFTSNPISVDQPIGSALESQIRLKMGIREVTSGGQEAQTEFQPLQSFSDTEDRHFTLWHCFPRTGRQHQIRVHLDHLGHPLVGDKLYGIDEKKVMYFFDTASYQKRMKDDPECLDHFLDLPKPLKDQLILDRHALHAYEIKFHHPITQKQLTIKAPLPDDLKEFCDSLKTTQNHHRF